MENSYQLITDSSSDLPAQYLETESILSMPLSFSMDGEQYYSGEMDNKEFYKRMREGAQPITSQINIREAMAYFESVLKTGRDVLYIAFSSGLSGTVNSARAAAAELLPKYPGRRIEIVDSLAVTLGQGLLVHLSNEMKKANESMDKVAQWARERVSHLAHVVLADDLVHLHRGGRIGMATTLIGNLLGIKPIIRVDDEGKAGMIGKRRGRVNGLNALVERMSEIVGNTVNQICCISHGDCEEDALFVKEKIQREFGIKEFFVNIAGPVLGAHTGPNAVALCFLAEHR